MLHTNQIPIYLILLMFLLLLIPFKFKEKIITPKCSKKIPIKFFLFSLNIRMLIDLTAQFTSNTMELRQIAVLRNGQLLFLPCQSE